MPWPTFPGHAAILSVGAARPMRRLSLKRLSVRAAARRRPNHSAAGSAAAVGELQTRSLARGSPPLRGCGVFALVADLLVSYVPLSLFP